MEGDSEAENTPHNQDYDNAHNNRYSIQKCAERVPASLEIQNLDDEEWNPATMNTESSILGEYLEVQRWATPEKTNSNRGSVTHRRSTHRSACNRSTLETEISVSSVTQQKDVIAEINIDFNKVHRPCPQIAEVDTGTPETCNKRKSRHRLSEDPQAHSKSSICKTVKSFSQTVPLTPSNPTHHVAFISRDSEAEPTIKEDCKDGQDIIRTTLMELKESVNIIVQELCSQSRAPRCESEIWEEIQDVKAQLCELSMDLKGRSPIGISPEPISRPSSSAVDAELSLKKEIEEFKSSIHQLSAEVRSSLVASSNKGSEGNLSRENSMQQCTGSVELSAKVDCVPSACNEVTVPNACEEIQLEADLLQCSSKETDPGVSKQPTEANQAEQLSLPASEAHRGSVNQFVLNKLGELQTTIDQLKSTDPAYLDNAKQDILDALSKARASVHSNEKDPCAERASTMATPDAEASEDIARCHEVHDCQDGRTSVNSLGSGGRNSRVQTPRNQPENHTKSLDRALEVLGDMENLLDPKHCVLSKPACPRALDLVSQIKELMKSSITPQVPNHHHHHHPNCPSHGVNRHMNCRSASPRSGPRHCMHEGRCPNHKGCRANLSKRPNPCAKRVCNPKPCAAKVSCMEDHHQQMDPRDSVTTQVLRMLTDLRCELQPLESGMKEAALATLEEIRDIIRSLQPDQQQQQQSQSDDKTPDKALFRSSRSSYGPHSRMSPVDEESKVDSQHQLPNDRHPEDRDGGRRSLTKSGGNPPLAASLPQACSAPELCQSEGNQLGSPTIGNIRDRIMSLVCKREEISREDANKNLLGILCDMEKVLNGVEAGTTNSHLDPTARASNISRQQCDEPIELQSIHSKIDDSDKGYCPITETAELQYLISELYQVVQPFTQPAKSPRYDMESQLQGLVDGVKYALHTGGADLNTLEKMGNILECMTCELCRQGPVSPKIVAEIGEVLQVIRDTTTGAGHVTSKANDASMMRTDVGESCEQKVIKTLNNIKQSIREFESSFFEQSEPVLSPSRENTDLGKVDADSRRTCSMISGQNKLEEEKSQVPGMKDSFPVPADSKISLILVELRGIVQTLETEGSLLRNSTVTKITNTFSQIEGVLKANPQNASVLADIKQSLVNLGEKSGAASGLKDADSGRRGANNNSHQQNWNNFVEFETEIEDSLYSPASNYIERIQGDVTPSRCSVSEESSPRLLNPAELSRILKDVLSSNNSKSDISAKIMKLLEDLRETLEEATTTSNASVRRSTIRDVENVLNQIVIWWDEQEFADRCASANHRICCKGRSDPSKILRELVNSIQALKECNEESSKCTRPSLKIDCVDTPECTSASETQSCNSSRTHCPLPRQGGSVCCQKPIPECYRAMQQAENGRSVCSIGASCSASNPPQSCLLKGQAELSLTSLNDSECSKQADEEHVCDGETVEACGGQEVPSEPQLRGQQTSQRSPTNRESPLSFSVGSGRSTDASLNKQVAGASVVSRSSKAGESPRTTGTPKGTFLFTESNLPANALQKNSATRGPSSVSAVPYISEEPPSRHHSDIEEVVGLGQGRVSSPVLAREQRNIDVFQSMSVSERPSNMSRDGISHPDYPDHRASGSTRLQRLSDKFRHNLSSLTSKLRGSKEIEEEGATGRGRSTKTLSSRLINSIRSLSPRSRSSESGVRAEGEVTMPRDNDVDELTETLRYTMGSVPGAPNCDLASLCSKVAAMLPEGRSTVKSTARNGKLSGSMESVISEEILRSRGLPAHESPGSPEALCAKVVAMGPEGKEILKAAIDRTSKMNAGRSRGSCRSPCRIEPTNRCGSRRNNTTHSDVGGCCTTLRPPKPCPVAFSVDTGSSCDKDQRQAADLETKAALDESQLNQRPERVSSLDEFGEARPLGSSVSGQVRPSNSYRRSRLNIKSVSRSPSQALSLPQDGSENSGIWNALNEIRHSIQVIENKDTSATSPDVINMLSEVRDSIHNLNTIHQDKLAEGSQAQVLDALAGVRMTVNEIEEKFEDAQEQANEELMTMLDVVRQSIRAVEEVKLQNADLTNQQIMEALNDTRQSVMRMERKSMVSQADVGPEVGHLLQDIRYSIRALETHRSKQKNTLEPGMVSVLQDIKSGINRIQDRKSMMASIAQRPSVNMFVVNGSKKTVGPDIPTDITGSRRSTDGASTRRSSSRNSATKSPVFRRQSSGGSFSVDGKTLSQGNANVLKILEDIQQSIQQISQAPPPSVNAGDQNYTEVKESLLELQQNMRLLMERQPAALDQLQSKFEVGQLQQLSEELADIRCGMKSIIETIPSIVEAARSDQGIFEKYTKREPSPPRNGTFTNVEGRELDTGSPICQKVLEMLEEIQQERAFENEMLNCIRGSLTPSPPPAPRACQQKVASTPSLSMPPVALWKTEPVYHDASQWSRPHSNLAQAICRPVTSPNQLPPAFTLSFAGPPPKPLDMGQPMIINIDGRTYRCSKLPK
ncbi:unnamed protein product [Mesocestoides corti]|uniref:Fibrous sheath-interacting protein 1 n=1 Tax=Mesocestoides corti TaxID=53468 RepID=A0A0R3UHT7_MESCO|nr:unnamed protein product [Mesocestoides corti]